MTIPPRRSSRRAYNRVGGSSSATNSPSSSSTAAASSSSSSRRRTRNEEGTLSEPLHHPGDENDDNVILAVDASAVPVAVATPTATSSTIVASQSSSTVVIATPTTAAPTSPSIDAPPSPPSDGAAIDVIVLDAAHARFTVRSDPDWTISQFKRAGSTVHKVVPKMQRLIYMGKLLQDDSTLRQCGIAESDKVVHLFPKPNVVVQPSSPSAEEEGEAAAESAEGNDGDDDDEARLGGGGRSGAHVPRIVLDAAEAERRSQILVLSSNEIFEAQHRVKLFSFLLLVVSSMELLTLFTILLGVPDDNGGPGGGGFDGNDDVPPGDPTDVSPGTSGYGAGGEATVRSWRNSDYFDLAISMFGLYVATLGIKAATENTVRLARQYFVCLVVVGLASNCYYYYLNLRAGREAAEAEGRGGGGGGGEDDQGGEGGGDNGSSGDGNDIDNSDLYAQAAFGIVLPLFVWFTCFMRSFQFMRLIEEAEQEAEERARGALSTDDGSEGGQQGVEVVHNGATESSRIVPYGGAGAPSSSSFGPGAVDDLELQVEGRFIS